MENGADRIVVSFRPPETDPDADGDWWVADGEWLRENLTERTYRQYLRRAHAGPVSVGDEWDEFVSCGCATPEDVVLRVERVDGGAAIAAETAIEVVPRTAALEGTPTADGADLN
nr:hypothetical protein [Halostella salina]